MNMKESLLVKIMVNQKFKIMKTIPMFEMNTVFKLMKFLTHLLIELKLFRNLQLASLLLKEFWYQLEELYFFVVVQMVFLELKDDKIPELTAKKK